MTPPRAPLVGLLATSAVGLVVLALIHWREVATLLMVAGAACLIWRFRWVLLAALGLSWLLG